jgi:hypothetical protein
MSESNPYAAPRTANNLVSANASDGFRWRLVPAAILILLGTMGTAIGVFGVVVGILEFYEVRSWRDLLVFSLGPAVYLAWGVPWLLGGLTCWKGQWKRAVALVLAGALVAGSILAVVVSLF